MAANRLASEPSPYLRQHAGNPVEWWPWGEAAFAEARRRGVPVFLSVGYATCHWCHVMAHESFEDPEVARLLNEAFVSVKVDREERPDVDGVYMAVCQQMTGSGGWPLTVLLTPDKKPFFAGTYFPKQSRHGRIGMVDLVPRVREAWRTRRAELERQAEHILQHVRGERHAHEGEAEEASIAAAEAGAAGLGLPTLQAGVAALAQHFDRVHGGFGAAPKFPSPHHLLFLLRQHARGDTRALAMVEAQLAAMARGGLRDHLGGGFHRYSTDRRWLLPHFEKMLYDQAMIAMAYTEAFQATGKAAHAQVARETLDYVLRDLPDPAGGFRCAEDADSEGVEGKFYVWTKEEILDVLGTEDGERFCAAYGVAAEGNFEDEATRERTGANILHLRQPLHAGEDARLAPLRARLLEARGRRVRPLLDDKVLTDWNGLAIAALAKAGTALQEPRYLAAAERCAAFLHARMRRPDGRLLHRWHDGRTDAVSFLDDHAFLLWGLLELHQATLEPARLAWALEVAQQLLDRFEAPEGGFFLSPSDGEELGARRRDAYDGALPSGNAVAAWCLHRLALLTGQVRWSDAADRALDAHAGELAEVPAAFTMALVALDLAVGPTQELAIAPGPGVDALLAAAREAYRPRLVLLRADGETAKVAPWLAEHAAVGGRAAAYLCEGHACKRPTTDAAELRALLG
ncbi:MAG TPA: thioredoxin domain-containing protein [Candidatus Thermoplasmatota archaeon]|nr:thioredoxin domain-containing protein [Candidatus Thermoplasmatota archaeon]